MKLRKLTARCTWVEWPKAGGQSKARALKEDGTCRNRAMQQELQHSLLQQALHN